MSLALLSCTSFAKIALTVKLAYSSLNKTADLLLTLTLLTLLSHDTRLDLAKESTCS